MSVPSVDHSCLKGSGDLTRPCAACVLASIIDVTMAETVRAVAELGSATYVRALLKAEMAILEEMKKQPLEHADHYRNAARVVAELRGQKKPPEKKVTF